MPKGVEHKSTAAAREMFHEVQESLMPKGVEHFEYADQAQLDIMEGAGIFDAERR